MPAGKEQVLAQDFPAGLLVDSTHSCYTASPSLLSPGQDFTIGNILLPFREVEVSMFFLIHKHIGGSFCLSNINNHKFASLEKFGKKRKQQHKTSLLFLIGLWQVNSIILLYSSLNKNLNSPQTSSHCQWCPKAGSANYSHGPKPNCLLL